MALEPEFLELAEDTITHAALSTMGVYGVPEYSTTTNTYDCHIEWEQRLIVTPQGKEEVSEGTIFVLSSSAQIAVQDKVVLSTTYDSRQPRLLRVDVLTDDEGQHHLEILV